MEAQENGRILKPNYCKIARVTHDTASPYYAVSLTERFSLCDTSLTVDGMRCLYYGGHVTLASVHQQFLLLSSRFGITSRRAGEAWWRYQMLLSAVWSTGNGSKSKPLHVISRDDAQLVAQGFDTPLWFKIKGKRKFCLSPENCSSR